MTRPEQFRVLVTGSRNWTNRAAITSALLGVESLEGWDVDTVVIMGDAQGADDMARQAAISLGYSVEVHKASWHKYGKRAGPDRNQRMVNAGANLCLAFPLAESKGTWDCVRRAAEAGIPVEYPAGRDV